jgi:membrane protein YqaA with SNARE-associated domain
VPASGPSPKWSRAIAAVWGFAEATVFFIVPDVFTSRLALTHSPRQALGACLWSVLGALLGGSLLYLFAHTAPSSATVLLTQLDIIPGISPTLIASASDDIHVHGAAAFFTSAVTGVPYKLCALQASLQTISYPTFLFASAASRALRFLLVTTFALGCRYVFLRDSARATRTNVHLFGWALFYGWYFYAMSQR